MSDPISTKTQSEDIELLLCRSEIYRFLSSYYRHPMIEKMQGSSHEQRESLFDAMTQLNYPNVEQLKDSLTCLLDDMSSISLQEWISQYDDCFSHTAHGTVSSYELEYGEEHTYRQPQQLGDIAAFYKAFGLKLKTKNHERVDHISIECEFMHYLSFKQAFALEHKEDENAKICSEASYQFLKEHLGNWAPSFALKLSKYAQMGLFKHLGDLTYGFIIEDCRAYGITTITADLPVRKVNENYDSGCVTCSLKPGFQTS